MSTTTRELASLARSKSAEKQTADDATYHTLVRKSIAGTNDPPETTLATLEAIGVNAAQLNADVEEIAEHKANAEYLTKALAQFEERTTANRVERERITDERKAFNERTEREWLAMNREMEDLRILRNRLNSVERETAKAKAELEGRGFGELLASE